MKQLKIAFRKIFRNKTVSVINISGLSLGVLVSLLLFTYVNLENTADSFIPAYSDIQIITRVNEGQHEQCIAKPMVDAIRNELGQYGTLTYVQKSWAGQVYLSHNGVKYNVEKLLDADSCFFQVFNFKTLYGNAADGLNATNKMVISKKLANKIFGNTNPVGQIIEYNTSYQNNEPVEITAVLDEIPQNSAWDFDAVISVETSRKMPWYCHSHDRMGGMNYSAFWKLNPSSDLPSIKANLSALSQKHFKQDDIGNVALSLKPYSGNYLDSIRISPANLKQGNGKMLIIMHIVAVLIMLIACINYVNLDWAQRRKKDKTVGIVKMLGSSNANVCKAFMLESTLILFLVGAIVLLFSPAAVNVLNLILGTTFKQPLLLQPYSLLILFLLLAITFIITGLLPSISYSNNNALELLKPYTNKVGKMFFFRNALPVFQFTISIALIICLIVIRNQNQMMLKQSTGFTKENIVYAPTNGNIKKNAMSFGNEIIKIPGVYEVTYSDGIFGNIEQNWGIDLMNKGEKKQIMYAKLGVSPNFFEFFGIKIQEGIAFLNDSANFKEIILNETACKEFGINQISEVKIMDGKTSIIGVSKDFNFKSSHSQITPLAFYNNGQTGDVIFIKLSSTNYLQNANTMKQISTVWDKFSPNLPLNYKFLDQTWNSLYFKELQFQRFFNYASAISIFISCLGLFGLSLFMAERKVKEIGIRKVNGSKVSEILLLLNKGFIKWVLISFVIAIPITYYAMSRWLETFAYKTELSWWIFALGGFIALAIALLTVSWQSWKAASRNPVEALRYE